MAEVERKYILISNFVPDQTRIDCKLTDIFFLQCIGCVSPTYMEDQADLNERMRAILVDWLIEVFRVFILSND